MPAVQPGTDLFKRTATVRFLRGCQQQALTVGHAKIASFGFTVAPMTATRVLSVLQRFSIGEAPQSYNRHFYYDSSHQPTLVGVGTAVSCQAKGRDRFSVAQRFVATWQSRFCYADLSLRAERGHSRPPRGYFFCSATFFEQSSKDQETFSPDEFEPVYVFVPALQVTTTQASRITFNVLVTPESDLDAIAQQAHSILEQLLLIGSVPAIAKVSAAPPMTRMAATGQGLDNFERAVSTALEQIERGDVRKVVLADVMDVRSHRPFDQVRSLQTLRQNHPDCTVFSVGNGSGQTFIGASPERLLSISQGQLLTDALAGSASRGDSIQTDRALSDQLFHSEKERYEHRVVVEYIARQLRSLGLNAEYDATPQLLRLRHIQHLHTPIRAQLPRDRAVSPLDVLAKLHPTPAVAGLPIGAACDLIRQQETFARGLYAAPIGWIDTDGNSEFMVGIRSALLDGRQARLYAGAGIVSGSEPRRELAEIKLKLQSLLNALVA